MEFFETADVTLNEQALQAIRISQLAGLCGSIDQVAEHNPGQGRMQGIWGDVAVNRACIQGGLRFWLPDCPCNLAWTLTVGSEPGAAHVVIHLTTSRQHHELDVIDAIHSFIADLKCGLEAAGIPSE